MPLSSSGWIIVALWPMAVTVVILGVRQRQSANLLARRLALLQTGGLEEAVPVKKPWLQVLTETWNRSQSAAAFNLRWTEYSFFILSGFLLSGLLGYMARGWPGGIVLGVIGGGAVIFYFQWKKQQYLRRAQEALPDFLSGVASALRAGSSLIQAMLLVAEETPEPLGYEIRRVLRRESLGFSLEQTLVELTSRLPSKDLSLAVMVINIQREVGGSLADILESIVQTIRERQRLTQEVRALTSQGRFSGWILTVLPFVLGTMIWFVNPTYMNPLFTTQLGHWLIGAATLSVAIGAFVIQRIVKVPDI